MDENDEVVTSRDVAKHAGVAQATVSRVLRNSPNVSEDTRVKVERAFRELGYRPNGPARAMRTRQTDTIGVVVSRIDNPFYPEMLQAISVELEAIGKRMIVWNSQGAGEESATDAVRQRLIDGLIFTTATRDTQPLREALAVSAPVVLANRTLRGAACDQIESDSLRGGQAVVDYFVSGGHRKVAMIGGMEGVSTSEKRLAGFKAGIERAGLSFSEDCHLRGDFTHGRAEEIFAEFMSRKQKPTAIFCVNDVTAFGAIDMARRMKVRVPEDVWIVGYDDIKMSSWSAFDLTTVRQQIPKMAKLAIDCLLDRIAGKSHKPRRITIEPTLVVRGSTNHHPLPKL
jgi:LacI family transcriptional regulator